LHLDELFSILVLHFNVIVRVVNILVPNLVLVPRQSKKRCHFICAITCASVDQP